MSSHCSKETSSEIFWFFTHRQLGITQLTEGGLVNDVGLKPNALVLYDFKTEGEKKDK